MACIYQFGPFHLDCGEHRLLYNGSEVPLQPRTFETLCALVENAGSLLKKEELIRRVWPDAIVEESNLNKNISLLRKALGQDNHGQAYIETVPRVGYRFVMPVKCVAPKAAPVEAAISSPGEEPCRAEQSVAVLYFENLSGVGENEYFRDGMTEDIITELAKIKLLRVFPRSAVLAFRDKQHSAMEVGEKLCALYVLEGSIRRLENRLRITAQLSETRTGHCVWAECYDRQLEDVFAIQDEIAQNIACALQVMLTEKEKREIEKVPTSNIQAYDYYLRGRQFFYQMRRKGLEFARQMFARAIVIDPGYARAYAGVADCCSFLYMWCDSCEDNLREAISAGRRAVELDPQSAEAYAALGFAESLNKNYKYGDEALENALRLDPGLFEAHYFYGRSCFGQSQFEKAAALFAQASRVNPNDYQAHSLRGLCFQALNRADEVKGALRDCVQAAERHLELHPDDVRAVSLAAVSLVGLDEPILALKWADRALAMEPEEPMVLYNVACAYALMDQADQCLECLEKAFDRGFGLREWMAKDPDFASVREHPRFRLLIAGATRSAATA